jgi:PIN domain nuclease of toxin-antitoxin system
VFLSAASIWELAIKTGLGKLRLPLPIDQYVHTRLERSRTSSLQMERLPIATVDRQIAAYDVEVMPAD